MVPKPHTPAADVVRKGKVPNDISYPGHSPQRITTLGTV